MELRSAEEELSELTLQYESLRRTRIMTNSDDAVDSKDNMIRADWCESLPAVSSALTEDQQYNSDRNSMQESSLEEVLQQLESLRDRLQSLEPKATKFRKRMGETDPITNAPRYGEKTLSRVKAFLETYDFLTGALSIAFGNPSSGEEEGEQQQDGLVPVELMRQRLEQEREAARQAELEKEERRKLEEQQKLLEEERLSQSLRRQEEEQRLQRLQEEQELARRAEESRRARLQAEQAQLEAERRQREEREHVDREWMAGITKGPNGIREQLAVLKESTASEPGAHETALTALHTLFSQIVAHPEEEKFRRVRRDHPKFNEDIGRHSGGRELLIAAGFRLGAVDEIPCFISTEPNVEKDLDGWSAWFDLLKATVDILEEEMLK